MAKKQKNIGIPLERYFTQIRHKAKQYGYKLFGEVMIELPNSDYWIYRFTKDDINEKKRN